MFEANEGKTDRIIRAIIGVVLLVAGYFVQQPWNYIVYVLGAISLVTSITGFCLIYKIFKINTKK